MKSKIVLFTTAFLISGMIWSQIIHVPGDQPTIQDGINVASDGDTVLVAENTYYENIKFMGKAITVASEYVLDSDSSHIVNTIIDGSQAADPDSAATVMFVNGEDTTSILNGFTITGGQGVFNSTFQMITGGGIYAWNSGCKILNNIITANDLENDEGTGGAGIFSGQYAESHWTIIKENYIGYNSSIANAAWASGGGMYLLTSCLIENNLIEYNSCINTGGFADGGGIVLEKGPGTSPAGYIVSNIIKNNSIYSTTSAWGAGIRCNTFSLINIIDNLVTENSIDSAANAYGGGISVSNIVNTEVKINNNIVEDNNCFGSVYARGGGIYVTNPVLGVDIKNNIISDNLIHSEDIAVGGGIFISNSPGPVEITNNIIENNNLEAVDGAYGGGIRVVNISEEMNISDNMVSANTLDAGIRAWGGGIGAYAADNINITNNTIEHNSGNSNSQQAGGAGINLLMCGKSFINNNEINENTLTAGTYAWGGGILIDKATFTTDINNNTINNNTSEGVGRGGGISIYSTIDTASYFINSNKIMDNYSGRWGGGLCARNSYNMYMVNNLFKGNESNQAGGAIMFYKSSKRTGRDVAHPVIANNTFINNNASDFGGAIFTQYDDGVPLIFNSIFWDNTAGSGTDLYNSVDIEMFIYNNNIDTSLIGTPWEGDNNIYADPEFADTLYHISLESPCFNTGIDLIEVDGVTYNCPNLDFEGEPRPLYGFVDIGLDEVFIEGMINHLKPASSNLHLRNYPNPFSSTTTIKFELLNGGHIKLEVYNSTGNQVATIVSKTMNKGQYQFEWDASQLPAGIYYMKLNNGMQTVTQKLIKMK